MYQYFKNSGLLLKKRMCLFFLLKGAVILDNFNEDKDRALNEFDFPAYNFYSHN